MFVMNGNHSFTTTNKNINITNKNMKTIKVEKINDKCICQCPKNFNVIKKFKNLNGIWDTNNKWWVFDELLFESIKKLMFKYYGTDNGEYKSCQLIIKNYTDSKTLSGIIISGFELCKAWGRDTGAIVSNGVALLDGEIDSGGSYKYWCTECADATFNILRFPISMLKNSSIKKLQENNQIEIINNN